MMGKTFERIVGKWSKRPKTIDDKVEENLKEIIGKMTTAASKHRSKIKDVLSDLKESFLRYFEMKE